MLGHPSSSLFPRLGKCQKNHQKVLADKDCKGDKILGGGFNFLFSPENWGRFPI